MFEMAAIVFGNSQLVQVRGLVKAWQFGQLQPYVVNVHEGLDNRGWRQRVLEPHQVKQSL
jgi:hypothetical protein